MTAAVIAGSGQTPFGRRAPATVVDLAVDAASEAVSSCGADLADVGGLFLGSLAPLALGGQAFPAAVLASRLGIQHVRALALEGACASGSLAFERANAAVRAGEMDVALVVGAEAMTHHPTATVTAALSRVNDTTSGSYRAGLTFPGFFALVARRYLSDYSVDREALADVVVKNRANGAGNPYAHFQRTVSRADAVAGRPVADPLGLYDCSPISDGAAAALVASREWADAHGISGAVEIMAVEQAGGPVSPEDVDSFLSFPAARDATERALVAAGVARADVDVVEAHDCFSIAELIALEDMGFYGRGEAAAATSDGATALDGDLPVNPSGGLLSKGHPVGATGVAQIVEIARQVRGVAANQVQDAEIGLAHNIGGTGGVAVVSVLGSAA